MLLLFAELGVEKPLTVHTYRGLRRMLEALGQDRRDPDGQVDASALRRLGLRDAQIDLILSRLSREGELEDHLTVLDRMGITVLTRISPEYPARLRRTLGDSAPMLLYCAGNTTLFGTRCVSLVGSRELRPSGRAFAREAGRQAALQGFTYVSGGASGADSAGFDGTWREGGTAILFLPDSLETRMVRMGHALRSQSLLLVSEQGHDLAFSAARAHSRNRLIHAMGEMTLVAQSDYGSGGTWQGTAENLKNGWSPVFVNNGEPEDRGTRGLVERGCTPISQEELRDLPTLIEHTVRD